MAAITALVVASIIGTILATSASTATSIYAQNQQNANVDKTNALTKELNLYNNQFNAEQAALQRSWEENLANTSIQRRVADLKAAGLNPALAVTNGASFTPSAAGASSSGVPAMKAYDYSPLAQLSANLGHAVTSANNLVMLNKILKNNPGVASQLGNATKMVSRSMTRSNQMAAVSDQEMSSLMASLNSLKPKI